MEFTEDTLLMSLSPHNSSVNWTPNSLTDSDRQQQQQQHPTTTINNQLLNGDPYPSPSSPSTVHLKPLNITESGVPLRRKTINPNLLKYDGFNNNYPNRVSRELIAESIVSLYDKDYEKEMDSESATSSPERPIDIPPPSTVPKGNGTKRTDSRQSDRNPFFNSLHMIDGIRSIDFVMAVSFAEPDHNMDDVYDERRHKRFIFEQNLTNEGLELETETVDGDLGFVKIHAPQEVLRRYAEILKLRMPMKETLCRVHKPSRFSSISNAALYISNKIPGLNGVRQTTTSMLENLKGLAGRISQKILVDQDHFPQIAHSFTAVYSRDKEYLFDINQPDFFTPAIRSRIVKFILDRKRFTLKTDNDYAFGVDRLISEEVYLATYPLHDGEIDIPGSMRHLLYSEWAALSKWHRYQPLDYIKEYFGVKIGLYFAWLGFYTYMLLLASVVGICCFIYSWVNRDTYKPSEDVCSGQVTIQMCPLCDYFCDYWQLTCFHVKTQYLFDNTTTVFFAVFMSFWATLFLELWKRYSAEITHRWDLTGFDIHEEHPRPQYLARLSHVKRVRVDYVTKAKEPYPPFWRVKLPATVFSFSVVILLVALAVAAVLGVVLYRISMISVLKVYDDQVTTTTAQLFTTATAACINLCLIVIFNWIYTYLAEYLTELELLRTQTEFDDSITLKIYLLQFVNYYASIFYIAFFKGKFIGYPGNYNRFFNFRQEECGLGGCLMELCIQLAIIMVGKQTMNTILEMLLPMAFRYWNSMKVKLLHRKKSIHKSNSFRWLRDLKLIEWGPRSLFGEYLEMVLQYGFVTIFVSAFPLAPFFALINNIFEMRLDAKKLLTFYRRPVTQRVRDIGIWYRILDSIGKLSVITNGFIIAFTSDFIPRLMYRVYNSPDGSLNGYLNYSLAYFNTTDLQEHPKDSLNAIPPVTICRYPDYREPPWSDHPYRRTTMYWQVLAARLMFVVLFENFVVLGMILVRWLIPDMSSDLRDQIRREAYITNEIIIKQEAQRAMKRSEESGDEFDEPDGVSIVDPNIDFMRVEQLMAGNISGSDFDLAMHGTRHPTSTVGQYRPDTKHIKTDETDTTILSEDV